MSTRIAAQIININLCKFISKRFAQAVHRRAVKPTGIGDETDNAFRDSVACPTKRLDIAVIERIFIGGISPCGVGVFNSLFKIRVGFVLVVIVGGALTDGIGRIADDNFNAGISLLVDALGIFPHDAFHIERDFAALVKLKSIGETNPLKRLITFGVDDRIKRILDINGGNVIGKQNDFVGVEFAKIFAKKVARLNQAALNQPRNKSSCACERIQDVNIFTGERAIKIFLKDGVNGAQDKIDDFNGGINDTEPLDGFGHRHFKKFVVKLNDNFLLLLGGVGNRAAFTD